MPDVNAKLLELSPAERLQVEARLAEFEQAWDEGRLAAEVGRLPPPGQPLRLPILVELVRIDLERHWQLGRRASADDYLRRYPELGAARAELAAAEEEAVRQFGGGEPTLRTPPAAEAPADGPPRVGGYDALVPLGEGGQGVVYKARHLGLNRCVALKFTSHLRPADLVRFRWEGEIIAHFSHANIVQIHEVGEHEGRPYFAMEFVDGGSLADNLRGRAQPPRQAAQLVEVLARTVHYAHTQGIIHRDLKPANVLLTPDGVPKLTDFGLARRLDGDGRLTTEGALRGTPCYMAPEQADGSGAAGPYTDTYGLGAILYEMLTGRPPFWSTSLADTLDQVRRQPPVPPSSLAPAVPRDLDTICLKCLEKAPARRYASAEELADDLGRFLRHEPIRARPVGRAERWVKWARRRPALAAVYGLLALVAVLGAAGAGAAWLWRRAEWAEQQTRDALDGESSAKRDAERARDRLAVALVGERQAKDRLDGTLALRRVSLAQAAWRDNQVPEALQLLAECPPRWRRWEWNYLNRLCHSDLLTFRGHTAPVDCVAFSPDGRRLASAGRDSKVRVWGAATGEEALALEVPNAEVYCVAFSPDGKRLAASSSDGKVRVWDADTGHEALVIAAHDTWVHGVAFSPDGKRLASAGADNTVKVWDALSGERLRVIEGHTNSVTAVAFSPDGKWLASASGDGTVRVYNALTWDYAGRFRGNKWVRCVAFSPDGKRLAFGGVEKTVEVWDTTAAKVMSWKRLLLIDAHDDAVSGVAFSPDGKRLASASYDMTLKVWDVTAGPGQVPLTLKGHTNWLKGAAFSPDGKRLASAAIDQTVKVWDARAEQEARTWRERGRVANGAAFSPDGRRVAAALSERAVKVWDVATGQEALTFTGHPSAVQAVAFSPDGRRAASAGSDKTVRVWDAGTGKELIKIEGHTGAVIAVAFRPDGKRLASASYDRTVRLWDADTGEPIRTLAGHTDRVLGVTFSPDGKRLATASDDQTVRVWDADTGEEVRALTAQTGPNYAVALRGVAFSPDGRWLASAGDDPTAKLWDTTTWQEVRTLTGHTQAVVGVAFSPDGERLATASYDKSVKVWDVSTGQEALTLRGHTGAVVSVAFSPDGNRLVSAGWDIRVKVWDATPLQR